MTSVDLDGVTFSLEVQGEEYSVKKRDINATEFYVDKTAGGLSIAPENHEGPTDYASVSLPADAAKKLANSMLAAVEELEEDA